MKWAISTLYRVYVHKAFERVPDIDAQEMVTIILTVLCKPQNTLCKRNALMMVIERKGEKNI